MSWIKQMSDRVNNVFNTVRPKLNMSIPPLMLLCEIQNRPGLSAIALTSAIIRRMPEAGIYTGLAPDGSDNMVLKLVRIVCEEVVKEIKDNMKITNIIPPTDINITGTGMSSAGPITITAVNPKPIRVDGMAN